MGYAGIESYTDPDVAVYLNGVYQARNATALTSTVDVDAIEVLRGPQGTLYGRNAYAGAIAVRTTRPDVNDFSGSGAVTLGNYGRVDTDLITNIPIVEGVIGARLALRQHKLEGYYRNHGIIDGAGTIDPTLRGKRVGEEQSFYLRPSLRITPTDRLDIQFIGEYFRERSAAHPALNGPSLTPTVLGNFGFPGINPFGDKSRNLPGDGSSPFRIGYSLDDRPVDIDQYFLVNETSYDTGFGVLRGIFSYMDTKEEIRADTDGENRNAFSSARWQDYTARTAEIQFGG